MVDADRRPTAREIEELIDLVRRDPASPAFIDLGEAYLALGRPRDAIQIGNVGLEAAPDNLEGRVMLARAHVALHQWKEAQGELLRVVKVDRSSRQGFALLGEVLLRRSDFERAVPVLQHAQNLDPTSPQILAMLRRARAGQPLDPPPPIPQPTPPRGETANQAEIQRSPRAAARPRPTNAAVPAATPSAPSAMAMTSVPPPLVAPPTPVAPPLPPAFAEASAPARTPPRQTAPPPPTNIEGVKPRIISGAKPHNAAAAALRQSAAVGENYLNDLLTGGLLDVAGVRVPEVEFDLRPDRRWGRSTRRAFIFLFVVLVLGLGGGGTWYWWTEKEKAEAVAELQRDARIALGTTGDYDGIVKSLTKLQAALAKDPGNKLTFAYYVESAGIASLLYGEARIPSPTNPEQEVPVGPDQVDAAYKGITQGDDTIAQGEPGWREMTLGKAAVELARLPTGSRPAEEIKNAFDKLGEVHKALDGLLEADKDDRWARWLKGRALLAAGDRKGASASFKAAGEGDAGVVVALIDQANLLTDDGKTAEALALYEQALGRSKDHSLAILGHALAQGEASLNVAEVIGELNAKFVIDKLPSRLAAWRWLAVATASMTIDDYGTATDALLKARLTQPPSDPRFWARVGWVHYKLGRRATDKQPNDLAEAGEARKNCIWFSTKAESDPTVQLVDAGLLLASGLPDKVVDIAAKLEGVRPKLLRTYALLDLGKVKDALALAQEIVKTAPNPTGTPCEADNKEANLEARTLCEQARMLSADTAKERRQAFASLTSLASASKNLIPRHALGATLLGLRDAPAVELDDRGQAIASNLDNAKKQLGRALEVTDDAPNPLLYRTLTAYAEVALIGNDLEKAKATLEQALEANAGFLPARALKARLALREGAPDEAYELLKPVLGESAANTTAVQLTVAEALVRHTGATDKDRAEARRILAELKDAGANVDELGRIAALVDPKLPEALGLPSPDGDIQPEKPKERRRRGR
jgi:predicted ribosomally synthesized peptide with SipW-like signal peptide